MGTLYMGDNHGEIGGGLIDDKEIHTEVFRYAKLFNVKIVDVGYGSSVKGLLLGRKIDCSEFNKRINLLTNKN